MRNWSMIAAALAVAACTTTPAPEAQNVELREHLSAIGQGCTRLGPVATEVSLWGMPTIDAGRFQAKDNLRADAWRQYRADTVLLEHMDMQVTKVLAQGTAFRCKA